MKEHKMRQDLYHRLKNIDDFIENKDYVVLNPTKDELINQIIEYFSLPQNCLIYPAKSYAVAIIYAKLLQQHFDENFYESLNDPTLLYENDQYFIPYSDAQDIYDSVLVRIPDQLNTKIPQIQATIRFFEEEFL